MRYDDIINYWTYPNSDKHLPDKYLDKKPRSFLLVSLLRKHKVELHKSILELGCNVGRNLSFLYLSGYRNLGAVEIDIVTINRLRQAFPYLRNIPVWNCAIENFDYHRFESDVIFSMAVLQHIHPRVFEQVTRDILNNAKEFIVTIEDEDRVGNITWRRNYKNVFHIYPFRQVDVLQLGRRQGLPKTFVARVFRRMK